MIYMEIISKKITVKGHSDIMLILSGNWLNYRNSLPIEVQY